MFSENNFPFLPSALQGFGAMRNTVLEIGIHFRKGLIIAVWNKKGIVSKALCSLTRDCNFTVAYSFYHMSLTHRIG